jgi:hypothetical protein
MSTTPKESSSLETEFTSFLLFAAGILFVDEAIIHYSTFFVVTHGSLALSTTILVGGNAGVGILFLGLAYVCWKSPDNKDLFGFVALLSGLLSLSYLIVGIIESLSPNLYFSSFVNYFQFVIGYGSVTIFVELLIVFFSFRSYRSIHET